MNDTLSLVDTPGGLPVLLVELGAAGIDQHPNSRAATLPHDEPNLIHKMLHAYGYKPKPYVSIVLDLTGWPDYPISIADKVAAEFALPRLGGGSTAPCFVLRDRSDSDWDVTRLYKSDLGRAFVLAGDLAPAFALLDRVIPAVGRDLPPLWSSSSRGDEIFKYQAVLDEETHIETIGTGPRPIRVFMAHASEDKAAVRVLHSDLRTAGFWPWLDEIDIPAGANWKDEIGRAIRDCDIFLACISTASTAKTGYVQRELREALVELSKRPSGSIFFIPARLDDCALPDLRLPDLGLSIADLQWVDLWQPDGLRRLTAAIEGSAHPPDAAQRFPPPPVLGPMRIVDVSFDDPTDEELGGVPLHIVGAKDHLTLDVKVRNVGPIVCVLKQAVLWVESVWTLEAFGFVGASLPVSEEYSIRLPVQTPPYGASIRLSQMVDPNTADRFLVHVTPESHSSLFVARITLLYDEDDSAVTSERFLFSVRNSSYTWPIASEQILREVDDQSRRDCHATWRDQWKKDRTRIAANNSTKIEVDAVAPGRQNIGAKSFLSGEPILNGPFDRSPYFIEPADPASARNETRSV